MKDSSVNSDFNMHAGKNKSGGDMFFMTALLLIGITTLSFADDDAGNGSIFDRFFNFFNKNPDASAQITNSLERSTSLDPGSTDVALPDTVKKQRVRSVINSGILEHVKSCLKRGVRYEFNSGASRPANADRINCSGFVYHAASSGFDADALSTEGAFVPESFLKNLRTYSEKQIQHSSKYGLIEDPVLEDLQAGMIIGMDTGKKSWDKGRKRGIDHVVMVYESESGNLMVAESRGRVGVTTTPAREWLDKRKGRIKMYAVDLVEAVEFNKKADIKLAGQEQEIKPAKAEAPQEIRLGS